MSRPRLVIADMAETPPRSPVTACFGVLAQGAQVLASNAVSEMFASSWKYKMALCFRTAARILGNYVRLHCSRSSSDNSKYSRSGFW